VSAPAFTPGPWELTEDGDWIWAPDCPHRGDIVCLAPETDASAAHWPANTNLIASAPDMVAALDHYADQLCEGWCEQSPDCAHFDDCGGCLARRVAWQARGGAR
jgi:hypothetical protein